MVQEGGSPPPSRAIMDGQLNADSMQNQHPLNEFLKSSRNYVHALEAVEIIFTRLITGVVGYSEA